ncbi:MAG: HAMP domain-containing protein [Alphaproteobacteria bacterium]|nr:HAMP domain-containing protein [Alphaproteobacteria bacterium]
MSVESLRPDRLFRRAMPRGLFGRSLIIIVAPVVILQGIVSYIFFERDIDASTRRLSRDIAADVSFLVAMEDKYPKPEREALRALAARRLRYDIAFLPGQTIPPPSRQPRHQSTIDRALDEVIAQQIGEVRHFETARAGDDFDIRVEVHDGVLRLIVPRERATVSAPDIFILWMAGSALILLAVAILFLRNQVRPIERLARAADAFGKGRPVADFKPYGASEVRRAAQAFLTMRERLDRFVQQRTEMLAGVSHDLKTPLTRIRLQLALMKPSADIDAMLDDVVQMESMLNEYLDFARGGAGEHSSVIDLVALARGAAERAVRARMAEPRRLSVDTAAPVMLAVKPQALGRCIANLVDNALKHGRHVFVHVSRDDKTAEIVIDDDGPGIAEKLREEAFKPFHRLDQGRNLQSGGVGLGLAIARDVARAHGGDLVLDTSPQGGLRAIVRLPV